jgi:hypothetical protein
VGGEDIRLYAIKDNTPRLLRVMELEDDLVTAIHVDRKDRYIVGTKKGKLFKIPDIDSPPQPIYGANEAHRVEELAFGYIYEIYVTNDGKSDHDQLWICAETGLWLLQQRFFKTVDNLPMNNPIAISMGSEGKAYAPINYLYEIAPKPGGYTARPIYDNIQVNAVVEDKDGNKWVTTTTPKVELLKFTNDRIVRRYDFHDRGESIFNLYPDSKGNIWFCQAPVNKPIIGIAMINTDGDVVNYDHTRGFSSRVLALKESVRGEIYAVGIGEKSYLYRYNPAQDRFDNLSPELPFTAMLNFEAHDLTIDDRGVVWLATTDGLLRYDGEKVALIQDDILGQEEVRGVTHYANNNIWIATATKGLVFHQQNTSTLLGETEGLPAVICAYRCINTDAEGHLWAGTAEGLVYSRMPAATLPYSNPPMLRNITINGSGIKADRDGVIAIRKGKKIRIQFSNLSFPAKDVQYQYRLLPKEDRHILLEEQLWESNEKNNTLILNEIDVGEYYLEVRAWQPGGYQWSEPLEIPLTVFLPWYVQTWFIYSLVLHCWYC